jgi:predicted RNase H-like HicB family nuclease
MPKKTGRGTGVNRDTARVVFKVNVFKDEDGYFVAYCEEIPGCASQGKTLKEAQRNFLEALMGCLETLATMTPRIKTRPTSGPPVTTSRIALTATPA